MAKASDAVEWARATGKAPGRYCETCEFFVKNPKAREWTDAVDTEMRAGRSAVSWEVLRTKIHRDFAYPKGASALRDHYNRMADGGCARDPRK